MRDIRADLRARAWLVDQQINAENTRFESLVSQLKAEQDSRLEHLKAQLHFARKLLGFVVDALIRCGLNSQVELQ